MTIKQRDYLTYLAGNTRASEEVWRKICERYNIHSKRDLYNLDKDAASDLIRDLIYIRCRENK